MASSIDPSKPVQGNAQTANVRANFQFAKDEIEALQAATTDAAIKTAYENNADTNEFSDAEQTKLAGIDASANNYSHPDHTGDVTSTGDGATVIPANTVTNAMAADMAAWTVKLRNNSGSGDPGDVKISSLTEEATPSATDWLLGEISTGEIRKFDIGNLPTGGGGEANLGASVGAGTGNVFRDKTGITLNIKSLIGGTGIALTDNTDDIDIAVAAGGIDTTQLADEGVTLAKMAHMATASLLGRDTAGTGDVEVLSKATALSLLNVEDGATADQTTEEIQDIAGPLVATGGTKTGIAVTYQDSTGDMDFVVDHDAANNFVADEHVAHTGVSITAGTGLDGGGTIAATRTINHTAHTGDVTGATALTIGANKVLRTMMETLSTNSFLGRDTAGTGNVEVMNATTSRAILNVADGATAGATWGSDIASEPATVSQAEAEAGTATTQRIWTAERVKQAIVALESGGPYVLLLSTAASGASVDFSSTYINSTYEQYRIVLRGLQSSTNNDELWARVSHTAAWKSGASDYAYSSDRIAGGNVNSSGDTKIILAEFGIDNDTNATLRGFIDFDRGGIGYMQLNGATSFFDGGGVASNGAVASGAYIGAGTAIDGFRLLYSTGTITSGQVSLYGLKES